MSLVQTLIKDNSRAVSRSSAMVKLSLTMVTMYAVLVLAEDCRMPNGELGKCILRVLCPGLLRAFANPFPGTEDYLHKFKCGNRSVCCGPPWDKTSEKKELSDRNYCGYQHSDDYHPNNGTEISIHEFPWLAEIMAIGVKANQLDILCQGVLISDRYVITIAQISKLRPEQTNITGVRLGAIHRRNKTGCVYDERYDLEECSTAVDYGIEKVIYHPFYEEEYNIDNIALIKLNPKVTYSDYIRPICLPTLQTGYAKPGDVLYITGWGFTQSRYAQEIPERSDVRKKIGSKLIDSDECRTRIPGDAKIRITSHVICTQDFSPGSRYYTCDGDAGAPVMFSSYRNQWYLQGIVTAIINHDCGPLYPVLSVRISSYLDWIKQNTI